MVIYTYTHSKIKKKIYYNVYLVQVSLHTSRMQVLLRFLLVLLLLASPGHQPSRSSNGQRVNFFFFWRQTWRQPYPREILPSLNRT